MKRDGVSAKQVQQKRAAARGIPLIEAVERRLLLSTVVVNTLSDPSIPLSGMMTLREAILNAQPGDVITFDPSLTQSGAGVIALSGAGLTIDQPITISGPGASLLSISGVQAVRPITVLAGAAPATIEGVSIIDGSGLNSGKTSRLGGGIDNQGTLMLSNCTISNCTGDGSGGGIYNTGALTLNQCTVTQNTAQNTGAADGGGIYNTASLTLIDSTISGNSADDGGAIDSTGALSLTNCTIDLNTADHSEAGIDGSACLANNSIICGNTEGSAASDVAALNSASSHNLIGAGPAGFTNGQNGNLVGIANPQLAPLADNGGGTLTMLPLAGSPAINAGDSALAVDSAGAPLSTDQRGQPRISGPAVDIGAVEVTSSDQTGSIVPTIQTGLPSGLISSQRVKVAVTLMLTNASAAKVHGKTTIALSVFQNASTGTSDTSLVTLTKSVNLKPGKSLIVHVPIRSLPNLAGGSYFLRATITDPSKGQSTVDAVTAVSIAAPFVQLAESFAKAPKPASLIRGKPAAFVVDISNAGNVSAIGSLTGAFVASSTSTIGVAISGVKQSMKIAAGRSGKVSLHVRVPGSMSAGTYYLALQFTSGNSFVTVNPSATIVIQTPLTVG